MTDLNSLDPVHKATPIAPQPDAWRSASAALSNALNTSTDDLQDNVFALEEAERWLDQLGCDTSEITSLADDLNRAIDIVRRAENDITDLMARELHDWPKAGLDVAN